MVWTLAVSHRGPTLHRPPVYPGLHGRPSAHTFSRRVLVYPVSGRWVGLTESTSSGSPTPRLGLLVSTGSASLHGTASEPADTDLAASGVFP